MSLYSNRRRMRRERIMQRPTYFERTTRWYNSAHGRCGGRRVNEASMRLVDYERMKWQNRAHFFAVSAQLMRRILVEHARRHNLKRGGGLQHVSLEETAIVSDDQGAAWVALDDAMNALSQFDPRKVQIVEMRFFGGLSVEETAEVLKISAITVKRDWR